MSTLPDARSGSGTTTAQWYIVSTSQPPGAKATAPPARRTSTAGATADRQPRTRNSTAAAATTSATPSPTMMPLTGSLEINTKPVTTVPTMAPAVPIAESLPTIVPVSLRLVSRSLVTIGVTAARNVPGTMIANIETIISTAPRSNAPAARTANGVAATATPDTASNGPNARRGGITSANRPPAQEPIAIAASATPMTRVLVSSVRPR